MTLLHGRLAFFIDRAEDLPDTDTAFWNISKKDKTDPFVSAEFGPQWLFKTRYINNTLNPVWEEKFSVPVCQVAEVITISVRDKEHVGDSPVGNFSFSCDEVVQGEEIEGWFDMEQNGEAAGKLKMSIQFFPKDEDDRLSKEVPDAYFPMRENNRLTLYQDADTPQLPQFNGVAFPDGSPYEPTRAWLDLFNAINNAQKFIYITGWSVFTDIKLVRGEEDPDGESHVGELLKKKADEGVRVLMLVWNEATSTDLLEGQMGTHDEDTRRYFEDSKVVCILAGRQQSDGVLANTFSSTCYTHHQKTVICDAEDEESGKRRIIAFIGGLDITDGRYDTCEFPLFKTISTLHSGDFYSNCVVGVTPETGPREPWHDNHAKVEGPAALDIKHNFEERWKKQADIHVDRLYSHEDEEEFTSNLEAQIPDNEGGHWNLQLFRSITSDSCLMEHGRKDVLHSKGGRIVENTIMRSMVHQIRNAKNFIYMENQYFLGSAYDWEEGNDTLAHHIVPTEIARKITDKINEEEDFKAYILIPMFPEGIPSSMPIQEILQWQYRTMQSMYRKISNAIEEKGLDTHPKDYLKFFCLGKREGPDDIPLDELGEPEAGSQPETIRSTLRHCIYVHSKMTIIDDDYVLIGSANINQRSLAGERDTEIAIGGYQPNHTVEAGDPRGDIHTYRMALWAAHFGGSEDAFLNPGSQECMEKVTEISNSYWDLYTADDPEHSDIHMLPYPINVEQDGTVSNLEPPFDCFPDTDANVLGKQSAVLPQKLTT